MDPKIKNLNSTTFFGRRFTRNEIAEIQETVAYLPGNSRKELAQTICENVNWYTPKGEYRWNAALRLLEQLEERGILTLPAKRKTVPGKRRSIEHTSASDPQDEISCDLGELEPLSLAVADDDPADQALWNELVDRHHYLNCPTPFGPHLRWFVIDRHHRKLGCLLLEAGSRLLPARDTWLGWSQKDRERRLHLVLNNSRFLILPWVKVPNLASRVLSMATTQLPDEWQERHNYRPVLIETFVDPTRFDGTCYKAANWNYIGLTAGKATGRQAKPAKEIYLKPLMLAYREVLTGKVKPKPSKPKVPANMEPHMEPLVAMWVPIIADATKLAQAYDQEWIQRQRVLNSLLVMLFVFRLVLARGTKGYATVLAELWEQCRKLGITLPQPRPVAISSISKARQRVDEKLFRDLHQIILQHGSEGQSWKGHRVLAIDGSKMNLPHPLVDHGYPRPHQNAHYPQGLVSCLYRLGDGVAFSLSSNHCERTSAKSHFQALRKNDIVAFDRGYFLSELLYDLHRRGVHPLFRLQRGSGVVFADFFNSDQSETIISATPQLRTRQRMIKQGHQKRFDPIKIRLVRRTNSTEDYVLATTLSDTTTYTAAEICDLYHQRWSIEELYKISKHTIAVDEFRGQTERGVRQELYAHFNLIAMVRMLTWPGNDILTANKEPNKEIQKVNFSHTLSIMAAGLEELMLTHAKIVAQTVRRMATEIFRVRSRLRPGRSYPRKSMQPSMRGKWTRYAA